MSDTETTLTTIGMHCQSCVKLIEMNVEEMPGVADVTVDLAKGETKVVHDDTVTDVDAIIDAIEHAGYGARRSE